MSQPGRNLSLIRGKPSSMACADLGQQLADRVHHAEVGPDRHSVAGRAQQLVQRLALPLRVQHPPGDIEPGFGELIAFEVGQFALQIFARRDVLTHQGRRQPLPGTGEDAAGPFGAIARRGQRARLAPTDQVAALHPNQDGLDGRIFAVSGPPGADQRHGDVIEIDGVDFHVSSMWDEE